MTARPSFRRRDHQHGRAPWPGPHLGPAGRAAGSHARGARAGPSAGGYGSAALCLISLVSHPSRADDGRQPGPGSPALRGTVRIPARVGRHPKVPAGWNIAARRTVTRRCYRGSAGRGRGGHRSHRPDAGVVVAAAVESQRHGEQPRGDDHPQQQHGLLPAQARVQAARLREGRALVGLVNAATSPPVPRPSR